MSVVAEETFCIDEYREYFPVIYTAISFLRCGMKKVDMRPMEKVDEVIHELFGINMSYASDFRKLFFPSSRCKENNELREKCIKQYKISHFNYKLMVSKCNSKGIRLSNEIRDGMLLLSTYALPVSEVLKENSEFEIHEQLRNEVKKWIDAIDTVMKNDSDLKARIFMYLHQFRTDEFIWWLLATLSSIKEGKINHWIDELHNLPSEKTTGEMLAPPPKTKALLDFYEKFPRLNASNLKTIYNHISVFDLQCAFFHIDYLKQLSHTPLRPNDIYLTYLILATLKQFPQELMLEQIAAESKARLPIKYCPIDEVEIDWLTQTAWLIKNKESASPKS